MNWYAKVPKRVADNLAFRRELLRAAAGRGSYKRSLLQACSEDLLFYVNSFCYTFVPKASRRATEFAYRQPAGEWPFVTFPFQDAALLKIKSAVEEQRELCVSKSRDTGASWMCLTVFDWFCRFRWMQTFLLGSRTEQYVDKSDDDKSLFWKLRFLNERLPEWLGGGPGVAFTNMHARYLRTNSKMDGESANPNFGRGDRRTAILMDEFAAWEYDYSSISSTSSTTNCRVLVSTPQGQGNAFADKAHSPYCEQLRLHWTDHPQKAAGLYRVADGKVEVLDRNCAFPTDYVFNQPYPDQFALRSPWFDASAKEAMNEREIAQEIEIDFFGSVSRAFPEDLLRAVEGSSVLVPFRVGELAEADGRTGFAERPDGRWRLWAHPDAFGEMGRDRDYVIGIDVATGARAGSNTNYSSRSTMVVLDALAREQVAQFATFGVMPHDFARLAALAGRWFRGRRSEALLIWEAQGPGSIFGNTLVQLGYSNFWWRRKESEVGAKRTAVPGFYATQGTNRMLLGELMRCMKDGLCAVRSSDITKEARAYVFTPSGDFEHVYALNSGDPEQARKNHADILRAFALAWWALREYAPVPVEAADELFNERNPPPWSKAWRVREHARSQERAYY